VPHAREGPGGGDGQPLGSQGRAGKGTLIEGKGCELVYLPPYSPDFNPIEQAFSKVKGLLQESQSQEL
jgi:DDE superfamily endonuclease